IAPCTRPMRIPICCNRRNEGVPRYIEGENALANMTPHVAQHDTRRGRSAIDPRTTRHPGYAMSQHARPRIERAFGWLKTIAGLRKVKLRGLANVEWLFRFASAAFNLIRLPKLLQPARRGGALPAA